MNKTLRASQGGHLMKALADGEMEVMEEIDHAYRNLLIGYFINRQREKWGRVDHDAAEDMASDTLLRVYEAAPRYRGGAVKSLVFRTAKNVMSEESRGFLRRHRMMKELAQKQRLCGVRRSVVEEVMRELRDDELEAALQRLNKEHPRWYQTVELRVVEERRYREIAEIMDCVESTARTRVYRALQFLYRELVENWEKGHINTVF